MQGESKKTFVYVAKIPSRVSLSPVLPVAREREIQACKSERVRTEKYCAWKLLEYALRHAFGLEISELPFTKTEYGKWETVGCRFSLSHSGDLLAAAVSQTSVGVDVQKSTKKLLSASRKFLTEEETAHSQVLSGGERLSYLTEKWTQKESIYKAYGDGSFQPTRIETDEFPTITRRLDDEYTLSLATSATSILWQYDVRYLP